MCDTASLHIESLAVTNEGWQFDELSSAVQGSSACPEVLRIRGYTLRKHAQRRIHITQPGEYVVRGSELSQISPKMNTTLGAAAKVDSPSDSTSAALNGGGSLHQENGADTSAVGGPLLAPMLPPSRGGFYAKELCIDAMGVLEVPLVLSEPSVATVDIKPSASGLVLTLLGDGGKGGAASLPVAVPYPHVLDGIELPVSGSGRQTGGSNTHPPTQPRCLTFCLTANCFAFAFVRRVFDAHQEHQPHDSGHLLGQSRARASSVPSADRHGQHRCVTKSRAVEASRAG